ncbi:MAG: hypothetical protein M3144_02330 [Actinomycetota bacterium]|nr:hypothetical protein [Actinomycetota bacterium]
MASGQFPADVPSHWSVTFADADAVAERTDALGGTVVTAPFDTGPGVRIAVLRDPQGAVFSVNRFDPGRATG